MLCRLSIQDVAVIDSATITLDGGFSVLTGETGAGKSLIIDAITMVLGGRTGRDIIRHGARCAVAEAAFFCQTVCLFCAVNCMQTAEIFAA